MKHFLVLEKDLDTPNPAAFLITKVCYFNEEEMNFYYFTANGYKVDNDLVGVWFGLSAGERKEDVTEEQAREYEKMKLAHGMKDIPVTLSSEG
ncbi:hypothetical protein [Thermoleptolyngbya sp. C42_A2020_037]|uniref:hypothetical protein n=1 Tax=Thermoleptolyngbya sp. C42_A2020_037 TaxID=2747799 RepID=UPI001A00C587|nr:hypothetical protein [Thermoleptolyngbya sp. C42_A2020_037]MBF2084948.1 hypothetical protein [Thermoleptolyngbya sp. C42_A2020_037]